MASAQATNLSLGFDSSDKQTPSAHKRTYQACIPCRRRKVRCDLGPVDDPHEPPCVRCRRESKECYFSATRRKRGSEGGDGVVGESGAADDDYAERNSRRKISHVRPPIQSHEATFQHSQRSATSESPSTTPPGGFNMIHQEPPPHSDSYGVAMTRDVSTDTSQEREVTNDTAAALLKSPINGPSDALHLLLEASGRSEDIFRQQTEEHNVQPTPQPFRKPTVIIEGDVSARSDHTRPSVHQNRAANIDPAITTHNVNGTNNYLAEFREALNAWSRLRFVRAGWLTAREAISYVEYYYEYLAPLTPITPPDFSSPATHAVLLNEEPMLTMTILTIAARYKKLSGPGGQSRSFMVHDRLWSHLQNMITRMFWGQEQFGGGFCGAGSVKAGHKASDSSGLRSLGTIESLLLLSEFHPRAMHFPPGDDDGDIIAPPEEDQAVSRPCRDVEREWSSGESTIAGWSEPALRSDRMCWSLIGASYSLASELGIFGNFSGGLRSTENDSERTGEAFAHHQRANRVERLLYIYITQNSGRLGFPSMFPKHIRDNIFLNTELVPLLGESRTPQNSADIIQRCWAEITSIMSTTNSNFFPSKEKTRDLIQTGAYIGLLQQHQPVLHSWQSTFERLDLPHYPKVMLSIDFEYTRLYANSLALQAVLEQWTTRFTANQQTHYAQKPRHSKTTSITSLYKRNEFYIKEVVDASRTLLRHVVYGLFPNDLLKHAPVRTYFRILSGAMFLLKTFALGAKEDEVAISLQLLDETVKALRTSVVDDVHLCLRIADLLEVLTSSIRHKFVRLAARTTKPAKRAGSSSQKHKAQYPSNNGPRTMKYQSDNSTALDEYYSKGSSENLHDPLAGIATDHVNLQDNNIAIMPPPSEIYINNNGYTNSSHNNTFNPHAYSPMNSSSPAALPPGISPLATSTSEEEDWLTLDLNPLLSDTAGFGNGGGLEDNWFGNFGPEINNNLEVLGRLFEGYDSGGGSMGAFS